MAEAAVGGTFLSAFLQVLFDGMASQEILHFVRGGTVVDGLPMKLKIICFL